MTFVEIAIPADFPYLSPTVKPLTAAAARDWVGHEVADYREVQRSWHREPTGRMCLFELEDHTRLPWADPATLLAQLKAWLTEDAAGWPTDEPTLDLERYFHSTGEVLLYGSLDRAVGHVVKLRQDHHGCRLVGSVVPPRRGRRGRTLPWPASSALVLDLGVPSEPVHDWTTLVQAAGANGELLVKAVDRGVRELVLCYQRGHHRGVLALRLTSGGNPWKLRAHIAAPQDPATLVRRSHPQREDLGATLVTVVGVGAIGSVMADLLHRSGVGRLELIDHDYLLPGNAVRHLAGIEHVASAPSTTPSGPWRTPSDCSRGPTSSSTRQQTPQQRPSSWRLLRPEPASSSVSPSWPTARRCARTTGRRPKTSDPPCRRSRPSTREGCTKQDAAAPSAPLHRQRSGRPRPSEPVT
ncbi:MAG: hypothetical protein HGA44_01720 [Cellulomonadaceae bacterium]|nr:hypothetical protein [Cellulomonadaceae bacterium]